MKAEPSIVTLGGGLNDVTECSGRFPDAGEVNLQDSGVCLNPTKACALDLGIDVSWKICFEETLLLVGSGCGQLQRESLSENSWEQACIPHPPIKFQEFLLTLDSSQDLPGAQAMAQKLRHYMRILQPQTQPGILKSSKAEKQYRTFCSNHYRSLTCPYLEPF